MMTSIYSGDEYRSEDRSSKFNDHAAVQFRQRHYLRSNGAGQLLEELNIEDSVELERLVHKTFPTMYGIYQLRKEEMQLTHGEYCNKELILYHVTTKSRALESLKSGLDWRCTHRSKFGCGVSFSDDADYANYYADQFLKEDSQVIIVCAVLVNITHRVSGKPNQRNLIVPPDNADTTVSPNGRVYVKYDNYDFYPLYLIYYQQTPEHLHESKYYFRNNLNNERQQNNQVIQQQQQELQAQRQRQRKQTQRKRKQVQCEQKQAQHELKQAQHELKQAQHELKQAQRELRQAQGERKQAEREQKQAQDDRKQAQRELRHAQCELRQTQRELRQAQDERKQPQRMQERGQRSRD